MKDANVNELIDGARRQAVRRLAEILVERGLVQLSINGACPCGHTDCLMTHLVQHVEAHPASRHRDAFGGQIERVFGRALNDAEWLALDREMLAYAQAQLAACTN
jgi:hypothetical protein